MSLARLNNPTILLSSANRPINSTSTVKRRLYLAFTPNLPFYLAPVWSDPRYLKSSSKTKKGGVESLPHRLGCHHLMPELSNLSPAF